MERTSQVEEGFRVRGKEVRRDSHKDGRSRHVGQSLASTLLLEDGQTDASQGGRDLSRAPQAISTVLPSLTAQGRTHPVVPV